MTLRQNQLAQHRRSGRVGVIQRIDGVYAHLRWRTGDTTEKQVVRVLLKNLQSNITEPPGEVARLRAVELNERASRLAVKHKLPLPVVRNILLEGTQ